jgi:hypothetical protein
MTLVDRACDAFLEALRPQIIANHPDAADIDKTWADATDEERAMFVPPMEAVLAVYSEAAERALADAYERAAQVADYAVERAERDWRDPLKQDAVKQVGREIAEVIRQYAKDGAALSKLRGTE